MKNLFQKTAAVVTLGAAILGPGLTLAETSLPPIQNNGQIEYLSGGIGKNEATAIKTASKHWPLTLEFAVKDKTRSDFAANVNLVVRDAAGHAALQTTTAGPFVLAKLAPGGYTVDATLDSKTLHKKIFVKQGETAKALFLWPIGTDEGRSS